jgi:DHA2 family multidrug resistance protein-like MFS transporter
MNTPVETSIRIRRRKMAIGLAVLALPTILVAMDRSVLYLALPHLSADLGASAVQQLWISDIHDFMIAGLLITMGHVGDRIGRKRLLLIGAAAFVVASVLAASATSPEMLIAARTLVGIAGSTLMPSTMALIRNMFPDRKHHTTAVAVWMGCFTLGSALGPVAGGAVLESFGWSSVFLLGVPIMVLLLIVGPKLLPEYRSPHASRLDLVSVVLSLTAILPAVYGFKQLSREGVTATPILAIVVGVTSGILFVVRQRRLASPLMDLRLFSSRTFSSTLALTVLIGFVAGTQLFVSMYLQTVAGLSPVDTALLLLPTILTTVLVIQLAPLLTRLVSPAHAIAGGFVLQVAGYLTLAQLEGDGNLTLLVTGMMLVSIGVGPIAGLGAALIMQAAPPEKAGSAASMNETAGEFGLAMGIAILGVVGTAVYQNQIEVGPGIPADVAASAGESIAGAMSAAGGLPAGQSGELLRSAYDALSGSLQATAVISAVITLVAAVLSVFALRHVPRTGGGATVHRLEENRPAATVA